MLSNKRKSTHIQLKLSINSKRRGKVKQDEIDISDRTNGSIEQQTGGDGGAAPSFIPVNYESQGTTTSASTTKSYYEKKKQEINVWQKFRESALQCLFERHAPQSRECLICKEIFESPVRCLQCSSTYTTCLSCAVKDHQLRPLHRLEIWMVRFCQVYKRIQYK